MVGTCYLCYPGNISPRIIFLFIMDSDDESGSSDQMFCPFTTHPDFISLNPNVRNANDMYQILFDVLDFCDVMEKCVPPVEKEFWKDEKLKYFTIDLDNVDRLYYVRTDWSFAKASWELIIRIQQDMGRQPPLYIHLFGEMYIDLTDLTDKVGGFMFLCHDASMFMRIVSRSDINMDIIHQSLAEDGVIDGDGDDGSEEEDVSRKKNHVPLLKFFCHKAISENKNQLQSLFPQLPNSLQHSVNDFINFSDANEAYKNIERRMVDLIFVGKSCCRELGALGSVLNNFVRSINQQQ